MRTKWGINVIQKRIDAKREYIYTTFIIRLISNQVSTAIPYNVEFQYGQTLLGIQYLLLEKYEKVKIVNWFLVYHVSVQ